VRSIEIRDILRFGVISGGCKMPRRLFAVASSLALTACIVQAPPGYWGQTPVPYTPVSYSQPYRQGQPFPPGWYSPTASRDAYGQPASQTVYDERRPEYAVPEPQYPYGRQGPYAGRDPRDLSGQPPLELDSPSPESYPPSGGDSPSEPINPRTTFADETVDYGVPPTNTLHLRDFDSPTPTHIQGAHTITTIALRNMLGSDRPPQLIDVIGGEQTVSLPNAIWLRDAGAGRHLDDDIQAWFDLRLSQLTGHDKSRPLVFFCASRMCWLAHNATLRALDLGYTDVYWYRGGRDAWQAAGLPLVPVAPPPS
jgi:PQQ-dependent catabolism-associated CXXCW motif protein